MRAGPPRPEEDLARLRAHARPTGTSNGHDNETVACTACLAQELGFVMGIELFFLKGVTDLLGASRIGGSVEGAGGHQGCSGSVTRRTVWGLKRAGPNSGSDTSYSHV